MPFVVYSDINVTSKNIGDAILSLKDFEELERIHGSKHFRNDKIDVLGISTNILNSDFLDHIIKTDLIIFVCSHTSSKGIASLTAHPEGNWSSEAKLGGKPRELSFAAPEHMFGMLQSLKRNNSTKFPVIYEATHHGPLLKTPSFFVEVGGNKEALESAEYANLVARSVIDLIEGNAGDSVGEPVLGIGGMHYAEKFTRTAFEKGYAFSHIMPKYYVNEINMLEQAAERSASAIEKAVIEWKSIKADDRKIIIRELEKIGLDYERV